MGPILGVAWPEGTPCTPMRALGVDAPTTAHGVAEKWAPRVPTIITEDNFADLCKRIYQSLLKTNPTYAMRVWKKRAGAT